MLSQYAPSVSDSVKLTDASIVPGSVIGSPNAALIAPDVLAVVVC